MEIFTNSKYRDVLAYLLRVARPPEFGAVARLNHYCAGIVRQLTAQKQRDWLKPDRDGVPDGQPCNWRFIHNGLWYGDRREWFDSGKLFIHYKYVNGRQHGEQIKYSDLCGIKLVSYYEHGELIKRLTSE